MATREENLKKINDELEKLNDEEIEKIAGGFYARSNVSDVKPDVNSSNPTDPNQSRIIHVRDEQSRMLHII